MAKNARNTKTAGALQSPAADVPQFKDGREFDELSEADKGRVWESYNRPIPLSETRPLSAAARTHLKQARKKMGRPKVGKGVKLVSVTVELGLLERADAYAKRNGLKRSQLIAQGLRHMLKG